MRDYRQLPRVKLRVKPKRPKGGERHRQKLTPNLDHQPAESVRMLLEFLLGFLSMRFELKIAILKSGLSQRAIAQATGIPESRLSTIVKGWGEVNPQERLALQRHLGVGPHV